MPPADSRRGAGERRPDSGRPRASANDRANGAETQVVTGDDVGLGFDGILGHFRNSRLAALCFQPPGFRQRSSTLKLIAAKVRLDDLHVFGRGGQSEPFGRCVFQSGREALLGAEGVRPSGYGYLWV